MVGLYSEHSELKNFLDEKYSQYASPLFVKDDPVQIPHRYARKEDIEIASLLAATLAWGQRSMIIRYVNQLLDRLGESPYEFVVSFNKEQYHVFEAFKYRTFCQTDCISFFTALNRTYTQHGGLQTIFHEGFMTHNSIFGAIAHFRRIFVGGSFADRSLKHVSNVSEGSAAKRLNLFLRWMVRPQREGIDFGLWPSIPTSSLMLPLDVHTARVARALGILHRKQNDWKAVEEVTDSLRTFDPIDPIKYDFALFGLGAFEKFK